MLQVGPQPFTICAVLKLPNAELGDGDVNQHRLRSLDPHSVMTTLGTMDQGSEKSQIW